MRFAIVGCGYVADFYMGTLPNHPSLELAGVADRDPDRARRFADHFKVRAYGSVEDLLADPSVAMVLNLTNPRSHAEVSRACLDAGKHVYTEKPLATDWPDAVELVGRAERLGVRIASAPCSLLGESAQTLWRALRRQAVGAVRLVYAEMDDGLVHRADYRNWLGESGSPWPAEDEFEVGCTLEHAGYYLMWLPAFFGPARSVTSFAACLVPDKEVDRPLEPPDTPDFSAACIEFASGVVARLTCSIVAPHDHRLRVFGDDGVLSVDECWDYGSPVRIRRKSNLGERLERRSPLAATLLGFGPRAIPPARRASFRHRCTGTTRMDFCRGPAELAASIAEGRPCRLSADYALHVNEIVLAIQDPAGMGSPRRLTTTFDPVEPMPWAAGP